MDGGATRMNVIFLLIDIAWSIAMGLLKIAFVFYACAAIAYGVYWLFVESPAGPYLIGAIILVVVISVVGAFNRER
jgi:hypothetical protein